MARSRPIFVWTLIGALVLASPALAQFGGIFSDQPRPVPPADVSPPAAVPAPQPAQTYRRDYRNYSPNQPVPPANIPEADVPPAQPLPAPMDLPPESRPGGIIESQPLAPPPGTEPATQARRPERTQPLQPQQGQPAQPAQIQPGQLQPGQVQPEQASPGQIQPGAVQPSMAPAAPATPAVPQTDEVVIAPPPERIANPTAVFEGLDKITGRTTSFKVGINETVQFGALQVTPKVCYSRPPTETPQTDAFVEVDEVTLTGKIRRIFTGWMFAASPGLNAVEHPIYDVWLTNCIGGKEPSVEDVTADEAGASIKKDTAKPAPPLRGVHSRALRNSPSFLPALR